MTEHFTSSDILAMDSRLRRACQIGGLNLRGCDISYSPCTREFSVVVDVDGEERSVVLSDGRFGESAICRLLPEYSFIVADS